MKRHASKGSSSRCRGTGLRGGILQRLLTDEIESINVPLPSALLGLYVKKKFPRYGTFSGRIAQYDPGFGYRIEYEDGDSEDLSLEQLTRLPLACPSCVVGRRVSKHFPGHGRFAGLVQSHSDLGYHVTYTDGDSEHLSSSQLLVILAPPRSSESRH